MKPLALVIAIALLTVPLTAQRLTSYERLVVSTTVVGIAPATVTGMSLCSLRLEGGPIRWRVDGTDPTSTIGTPMEADETLLITNIANATIIRFIRSGGSNGTLNITCYTQQ